MRFSAVTCLDKVLDIIRSCLMHPKLNCVKIHLQGCILQLLRF